METYPSEASEPGALSHRLEELAAHAAAREAGVAGGTDLTASLAALRDEIGGLRDEMAGVRDDMEAMRQQVASRPDPQVVAAPAPASDSLVEERLAAIEDSLDGLAEGLESLARDSATDAGERLASLDDRIAALAQSLQAERDEATRHRENTEQTLQQQRAAVDEWAETVRGGFEELGGAVTSSLGSLSESLARTPTGDRDAERRHIEALMTDLSLTVEESIASLQQQIEASRSPLEDRIDDLHSAALDGFGAARARLVEELSGTIERLEHANNATRATLDTELAELRGDLADALDEVRESVAAAITRANETVAATVNEASESIAATVTSANETMATTAEQQQAASTELRDAIETATATARESSDRLAGLEQVTARLDTTLRELQGDWRPKVDAVVAESRASAQGVLEQMQAEHRDVVADLRQSLAGHSESIDAVTGSLGDSTEQLIAAGQGLLAYLGERDLWLERERDRILHEVLDEFAQGLSAKERRAVSSRMSEALDRRRDARDAERFRRTKAGKPAVEIPPVPTELSDIGSPMPSELPAWAAEATTLSPDDAAEEQPKPTPERSATKKATSKRAAKQAATKSTASKRSTAKRSTTKSAASKRTAAKKTTAKRTAAATKTTPRRDGSSRTSG